MQTAAVPVNRFSIADWPEKDRLGMLHDVYTGALLECDIAPTDGDLAEFTASSRPLPGLDILSVASSGLHVRRSKTQIDPDHIYLNINLAGTRQVSQRGREAISSEGEAMFIAGDAGVAMTIASGSRFMTLKMEVTAIEPLVPDYGDRLIRPVPRQSPALQLLAGYLGTLGEADTLATPNLQRVVATHVHDLAALALGALGDGAEQARERSARSARLQAIKADVAANLDGDTSVNAVAGRHHVTPRSVQMAFEAEGTTFTDFVLGQRLGLAHRMLTDPLRSGQKISTVAFDAGFGDLSYFNRVFRRRFEATPSEVRANAVLTNRQLEPHQ